MKITSRLCLRETQKMWARIFKRAPSALVLGTLLLSNQSAVAWNSDCLLFERASVVSHQAADFETIIFYDKFGELDFMGLYLESDTQNSRYEMEKIRITIDSEVVYIKDCRKSMNGTNSLLCSVNRDANSILLQKLDTLMRDGTKLSIAGAGSASLIGYTKSARQAAGCR